jgi:hypothetical protein
MYAQHNDSCLIISKVGKIVEKCIRYQTFTTCFAAVFVRNWNMPREISKAEILRGMNGEKRRLLIIITYVIYFCYIFFVNIEVVYQIKKHRGFYAYGCAIVKNACGNCAYSEMKYGF